MSPPSTSPPPPPYPISNTLLSLSQDYISSYIISIHTSRIVGSQILHPSVMVLLHSSIVIDALQVSIRRLTPWEVTSDLICKAKSDAIAAIR